MINAVDILQEKIITTNTDFGKPSQVGYDLSVKEIYSIGGKVGMVLKNSTILNEYKKLETTRLDGYEGWLLYDGVYEVVFNEGCIIPDNRTGFIKQRSSLKRNGAEINSPVFDPGFKTENMGTILKVNLPIFIEINSRLAQIYFHENNPVDKDKLYNGMWMEDKQRKDYKG